ncbi:MULTISPECIES: AraC family transcriptional regulator [Paenibacillus]|uniref:AraC family transcriptional regulator n=1 Tax=Paenibacillus TaxID=44249 RepID=UPI0011EB4C61|nr:AraC family transcriptional regulator [Paenibacillus terrae]MBE0336961.1 AraC family transcriptional regulator [Paenibacillus sp. 23TSA30-6]
MFGVHIHQHVYWKRKEFFQLAFDTDAYWIAYVIEEGKFAYTIKEHRGEAKAGSLILCPPEEVFHRKILTPLSFHFFRFSLPEASSIGASIHAVLDKEDEDRFLSNCRYLCANALDDSSHVRTWKNHLLEDLLFLFWSRASRGGTEERTNRVNDPLIQRALHYFQEHACEPLSIKETAACLGLSSVQFTRRFQAAVGLTPIRYVTSLRLEKAQTLLLETEYTLDDIAEKCGYLNGFYFSRVFSARRHISPSQYRKLNRI